MGRLILPSRPPAGHLTVEGRDFPPVPRDINPLQPMITSRDDVDVLLMNIYIYINTSIIYICICLNPIKLTPIPQLFSSHFLPADPFKSHQSGQITP